MGFFSPEIPAKAKQTNCWRFLMILGTVLELASLLSEIISGIIDDASGLWYSVLSSLLTLLIFWVAMNHMAYVLIEVTEAEIHVSMGPWQWPFLGWLASSKVVKADVVMVDRKRRECCWDVVPRLYCAPCGWCCCHKSYSAYFWPCCCNDGCNYCGCCEGDSDSAAMVQINLTQEATDFVPMCCKRCAPCPLALSWIWCCVYNRIAVSVKDDSIFKELETCGYPLAVGMNASEETALVPNTTTPAV